MPKLVKELPQGSTTERSSQGESTADSMTRIFRVVLDYPNEPYNIQDAVGVYVGDPHPVNVGVPCVSVADRADGESRVVRIITATYRTTAGSDPQNGDPKLIEPEQRVAKWSIDAGTAEVPVTVWGLADQGGTLFEKPLNPARDPIEGIFKTIPIIKYSFEQFQEDIPTISISFVGAINDNDFVFKGITIKKHHCMLRGIRARPHIETWGQQVRRGYMIEYEFVQRTDTSGWNIEYPLSGFNCMNQGLGEANVETGALTLELTDAGRIKDWPNPQLAIGTEDRKVRANILVAHFEGGAAQRPSAQPVPLNEDGTPRANSADPPVLTKVYRVQDDIAFGDDFKEFGIRL